jgi:hypothetical protein
MEGNFRESAMEISLKEFSEEFRSNKRENCKLNDISLSQ